MNDATLHIDIYSDVICPWCYIGKRRLDRVLSGEAGEGVSVRWRAYQLRPETPPEGYDRVAQVKRRYGENADLSRVPARIASEAAGEGLQLDYSRIRRTPNTLQAHRLLWFAFEEGGPVSQHALAERLFEAHFHDGLDVGDVAVLEGLAIETGLDEAATATFLESERGTAEVREELARAADVGISGVPCYVLGNVFPLPGAQTEDVMRQFIEQAKRKLGS